MRAAARRHRDACRHAVRLELFERESIWLLHQRRAGRIRCRDDRAAAERRARERNRGRRNIRCARVHASGAAAWRRRGAGRGRDDLGRSRHPSRLRGGRRRPTTPRIRFRLSRDQFAARFRRDRPVRIPCRCRQHRLSVPARVAAARIRHLAGDGPQSARRGVRRRWRCLGYRLPCRRPSPVDRRGTVDRYCSCRRLPAHASQAVRRGGTIRQAVLQDGRRLLASAVRFDRPPRCPFPPGRGLESCSMTFPFEYDHGVPLGFGGALPNPRSFDDSRVVILPVPVDRTTSYVSGTRNGPHEILQASSHMELWDEEVGADVHGVGIFTLPEMELPFGELAPVMDEIQRVAVRNPRPRQVPRDARRRAFDYASARGRGGGEVSRGFRSCRSTRTRTCATATWARRTTTPARCGGRSTTRR